MCGVTTVSITTLSGKTFCITSFSITGLTATKHKQHNTQYRVSLLFSVMLSFVYASCHIFIVMLSVVSFTFTLSAVIQNTNMLSIALLSVLSPMTHRIHQKKTKILGISRLELFFLLHKRLLGTMKSSLLAIIVYKFTKHYNDLQTRSLAFQTYSLDSLVTELALERLNT